MTKITMHVDFCKLFAIPVEIEGDFTEENMDWNKIENMAYENSPQIIRDYIAQMSDKDIKDYLQVSDGFIEDDK